MRNTFDVHIEIPFLFPLIIDEDEKWTCSRFVKEEALLPTSVFSSKQ